MKKFKREINNNSIHWLKYISEREKHSLLKNTKLLLWPSFYEGYGFPPVESITHEVPVVTSYRTSLPEVLKANAFYVNPYNYGEIATVCNEVLKITKKPKITYEHSWQDAVQQFIKVLKYENWN